MKLFMVRFARHYTPQGISPFCVAIIEHDVLLATEERVHLRPDYTVNQAALTADWLNQRAQGYPRRAALKHLYNGRG